MSQENDIGLLFDIESDAQKKSRETKSRGPVKV